MSVTEAAELLRVSRPVIYRMIEDGTLTPINRLPSNTPQKRARRLLFNRADVVTVAQGFGILPPTPAK